MNNYITLIAVALICSSLTYGSSTTITTTTTTTAGVTTVTKVIDNNQLNKAIQVENNTVQPRLSVFGAYSSLANLYVPLSLKNRRKSINYEASFAPSEQSVSGYGAELFLPFNNRFGVSIGYKSTGEVFYQDVQMAGLNQDEKVTLPNQMVTKFDVAYLNLVLHFGTSLHVYGGFNYLISPPSFETLGVSKEAAETGLKMGWQAGLGYNITSFMAVFAQYDVYYFTPSGQANGRLNIDGTQYFVNTDEDTFTSIVQAGIRLDLRI